MTWNDTSLKLFFLKEKSFFIIFLHYIMIKMIMIKTDAGLKTFLEIVWKKRCNIFTTYFCCIAYSQRKGGRDKEKIKKR